MTILLDTHVFIWTQEAVRELGPRTLALLEDPENELYASPITTLEISRLISMKQIAVSISLQKWMNRAISELFCETAAFTHAIARAAYELKEPFHKDPADRILVASAILEDLTLLTADKRILSYPYVRSFDARS